MQNFDLMVVFDIKRIMNRYWVTALFGCILFFVIACQTDQNAPVDKKSQGERLFRTYCITCHGVRGNLGVNGAGDLTQSVLSLDERMKIIRNGKNTMIAFEKVLSPEEIQTVAQYTLSLKQATE
jgi:mono/diheme cytochrome c family protein